MSNNTDAKAVLGGTVGGYGGEATINALTDVLAQYHKPIDASAAAALSAKIFVNPFPFPLRIVSAVVSADGSVALSGNAAGISLNVLDAAGNVATGLTWSTASGAGNVPSGAPTGTVGTGLVANVPQQATGVPPYVQPGGAVVANVLKLASGVTLPELQFALALRKV